MATRKVQLDTELLRARLKLKSFAAQRKLLSSHRSVAKFLTSGALAGTLFLSAQSAIVPPAGHITPTDRAIAIVTPATLQQNLATALQTILPPVGQWQLNREQEKVIGQKINEIFGLKAQAELENHRLNNAYGRMGAEQHLPRFPGDTVWHHGQFLDKGITPGLGGWGYVADFEVEKYYVAVQTLYLPDWPTHTKELSAWYKYRRVAVINPANGKIMVAAVADAGPAAWTGKHFGGSPEVMAYLEINYGQQNHPVVLFFLDDSQKEIPLGPVEYNVVAGNPALTNKS